MGTNPMSSVVFGFFTSLTPSKPQFPSAWILTWQVHLRPIHLQRCLLLLAMPLQLQPTFPWQKWWTFGAAQKGFSWRLFA
jgi:hypothetical protein